MSSTTWRHLPAPARAIAEAASDAITAAQRQDRDTLDATTGPLAAAEGSGLVLGTVVRLLLEEAHPDGLDSADIRQVIEQCTRAAAAWDPTTDPQVLLILLASALGVYDPDEASPPPPPDSLARHAALLVAHLLAGAPHPFATYLTAALTEIERAELHDD